MAIRNTAKAAILREGKLLLVRFTDHRGTFYTLPGGGQRQYETMEQAVQRECLEETGYRVKLLRPLLVHEEIYEDEAMRRDAPDYAHRIHFVFLCAPVGEPVLPTELDRQQVGCGWAPLEEVARLPFEPEPIGAALQSLIEEERFSFLGSFRVCRP